MLDGLAQKTPLLQRWGKGEGGSADCEYQSWDQI